MYLSKLPKEAKEKDVFYLTPLPKKPSDVTKPWYTLSPVGKNRLNGMLKEMCAEAGLTKGFSNHSLRVYETTTLFQSKVPEKLIQMHTGHKSLDTLRAYEQTSELQPIDVSHLVYNANTPNDICSNITPSDNYTSSKVQSSSSTHVEAGNGKETWKPNM